MLSAEGAASNQRRRQPPTKEVFVAPRQANKKGRRKPAFSVSMRS